MSTEKPKVYTFRANDGEFDRYQDRLSVKGWKLESFNALKGPVLLNHDAGDGGFLGLGRRDVLSLGKARAYVQRDALMVDIEFDPTDPEALRVEKKLDWLGDTGAVSVRYSLPEGSYRQNEKGGLDSDVQELLEISIVTIPGNQRALRVKSATQPEPPTHGPRTLLATRVFNLPVRDTPAAISAAANRSKQMEVTEEQIQARIEIARQAGMDEAMNKIMSDARGQRSSPFAVSAQKPTNDALVIESTRTKGSALGAYTIAWLNSGGAVPGGGGADPAKMTAILKNFGQHDLAKGIQAGVFGAGGAFIPSGLSGEMIELLVQRAVLTSLGALRMDFKGSMNIGRVDSGPTAQWLGAEGVLINKSTPATSAVVLQAKKLGILCDASNDILRNPKAGYSDAQLMNDMVSVAASEIDRQGLIGTGVTGIPKGLINLLDPAQSFAKAGTTFANLIADTDKLVKTIDDTKRPREKRGFAMGTAVESMLLGARDGAVGGQFAFRDEMLNRHTVRGFPYAVTTWMPTTHLIFGEFADLIFGVDTDMELAAAPGGDRFAYDETTFRLITSIDWQVKRPKSFACINNY